MEVLVCNHRFNAVVVGIGRGGGIRQHVFGIEDVETFILHCPHVEVTDCHDHVLIEIEFQAKAGFVPMDRVDQRIHRVPGLGQIARLHINLQQFLFAASGFYGLFDLRQIAGHQRKQV